MKKKEKIRITTTCPPWDQVLSRAVKVPAGKKSDSPKACSRGNWIFESESGSDDLLRVGWEKGTDRDDESVRSRLGGDRPPSRPNSSSSASSSSDWKADADRKNKRARHSTNEWALVVLIFPHTERGTEVVKFGFWRSLNFNAEFS